MFDSFWIKYLALKSEPFHFIRFEKESRYYELRIVKDLLGDWTLISANGRIKSKLGQSRIQAYNSFNEVLIQFYHSIKLRHQRHYHITHFIVEDYLYLALLINLTTNLHLLHKVRINNAKPACRNLNKEQVDLKKSNTAQSCFLF